MKRIGETEATIRAINKIAKENKNAKNAIVGIISLSGGEINECKTNKEAFKERNR